MAEKNDKAFILWFDDIYQKLTSKGVAVPHGFAVTAYAYRHLLKTAGVEDKIKDALEDLDTHDMKNLAKRGKKVREIIRTAKFPDDLRNAIIESYKKMEEEYGADVDVAVRSSATAEDLPDASFAGQQETYLNIQGPDDLIKSCRKCFASLFTNRAISYRHDKGFNQLDVYLSIAVQKMIRSDSACSGVIFSIDTESGFNDAVFITGSWGLGENVVQGTVNRQAPYCGQTSGQQGAQDDL
jgi:pyruvate,water dikinase